MHLALDILGLRFYYSLVMIMHLNDIPYGSIALGGQVLLNRCEIYASRLELILAATPVS